MARKRYGLSKSALPWKLREDLAHLQAVAQDPQPNLSRVGVCNNQLQADSFQRHAKNIVRYAGVLTQFLGVEACSLSLWVYTYMSHFFLFLSFLQARKVMTEELKKQVQTGLMVLGHLRYEEGADLHLLDRCSQHLGHLGKELGGLQQRVSGASTNPPREVPPAGPVIAWQDRVMAGALEAARVEMASNEGLVLSCSVQEQVRDAALLGLAFGHACLVARLTLLRSVRASAFANTPCEVEGCVGHNCRGNRLERVPNPSYSPRRRSSSSSSSAAYLGSSPLSLHPDIQSSPHLFKLCCAHHKNSSKGVPGFEVTINSPSLHALLVMYEESCRGALLIHAGRDLKEDDPATLFFNLSTGMPLAPIQLDAWFRDMQVQHELGVAKPLPQSHLRQILTSDRRENPHLPGPSDHGAALGMGNSVKVKNVCIYAMVNNAW